MGFTETIIVVFIFGFTCLPENGIERVFLVISGASLFLGKKSVSSSHDPPKGMNLLMGDLNMSIYP